MEAPGEEVVVMGSKEHTQIVKGKRTKRQRPLSPIPLAVAAANSVSSGDGCGFDCINGDSNNINKNCEKTNVSSSSTSNEYFESTTEEEEDMANCLILLAQGQSREFPKQADGGDVGTTTYKFNSRRFMETASAGNGKAGYYVYECKTCNRTFPSFQALGGHRASHKKPKPAYPNEKKLLAASSDEEDGQHRNVSLLSLQLSSRGLYNNNNNNGSSKGKVHECSICGAEFTSGQALGGHMRRHRGTPVGANAGTALSLTPIAAIETDEPKKPRNVLSLDLDLNLPAPEDDNRVPELPFASKREEQQEQQQQPQPQRQQPQQQQQQQQQSPLVFSAPALVGCHY